MGDPSPARGLGGGGDVRHARGRRRADARRGRPRPTRAQNLLAGWRAAGIEAGLREVDRLGWDRFFVVTDDLGEDALD